MPFSVSHSSVTIFHFTNSITTL
ncbi:hypothetical protein EMIT047CA2_180062 [Pseudomonas soli]